MAKAKLNLTFEVPKSYKVNEEGIVNMVVKCPTSEAVPKGLKSLGETVYSIMIGPRQWKKVASSIKEDTKVFINGEMKAAINSKGTPFNLVNCFDIGIVDKKESSKDASPSDIVPQENTVKKESVVKGNTKNESNPTPRKKNNSDISYDAIARFRNEKETVIVPLKDVYLEDTIHLNKSKFNFGNIEHTLKNFRPLIVRPTGDNKYALVMGLSHYALGKMLNMEGVEVIFTDYNYLDFIDFLKNTYAKNG